MFFSISISSLAQPFWEKVLEYNPYSYMEGIAFNSKNWAYLSCGGDSAGIFRSKDYGATWQRIFTGRSDDVRVDKNDNIIATATYRILRSTNDGDSWVEVVNTGKAPLFYANLVMGYDSIILSGCYGINGIVRSADHGITWERVLNIHHDYHYYENITDFCYGSNGIIYASTDITDNSEYIEGNVYSSADLGKTWQLFLNSGFPKSLGMDTSGRLLLGQHSNGLWRYDFNEAAWQHAFPWAVTPINILVLPNGKIVLGLYESIGGVLLSEDNGETYQYKNEGLYNDYHTIRDMQLDQNGRLWICDDNLVFRTINPVITSNQQFNRKDELLCYPNPFHDFIWVEYNSKSINTITCTASIYNSNGQLVFKDNTMQLPGRVNVNLPLLPAGVYLINITGHNLNLISKIIHF